MIYIKGDITGQTMKLRTTFISYNYSQGNVFCLKRFD